MQNLNAALNAFSRRRFDEAEVLSRRWLATRPDDRQAVELLAVSLVNLKRLDEAKPVVERLVALDPGNADNRIYLGILLLHQGQLVRARAELIDALKINPRSPAGQMNLGLACFLLRRHDEAVVALGSARRLAPTMGIAAIYESRALIELDRIDEARAVLAVITKPETLQPEEANEYALACMGLELFNRAEKALRGALARSPADQKLLTGLANLCERNNRVEEAEKLLAAIGKPDESARHLSARLAARRGDVEGALREIQVLRDEFRANPESTEDLLAQVEFDRGRWLDQTGRHEGAFAAFAEGNRIDREAFRRTRPECVVDGGLPWLESERSSGAFASQIGAGREAMTPQPVFLVGFPRSGTTLLDQMLDAHPQIQVLEEKPIIETLVKAVAALPGGYPGALTNLSGAELERLRALYWTTADTYLRRNPQSLFVDKNPFNLCRTRLASLLFPRARWIFAIRHPLDAILSCYMNRFRYTEYSHGFWSLEEIARIYRDTVGLWLDQRGQIRAQCFDLHYERLVEQPEVLARQLFEFLAVPWDPQVLSYHQHARSRRIATPSYDQVVKPIYKDAVERWRHYSAHLADAALIVNPFATALGYDGGFPA